MKHNKTGMIGIIITIIVLIVVVVLSNMGTNQMQNMQTVISKLFMPFQNGYIYIKNKITGDEQQISDIEGLKNEIQP